MTPTEMETVLQNLDARLLRVEQILPTLATKQDLGELRRDLKGDVERASTQLQGEIQQSAAQLREDIGRSANGLRVLIEDSRSENQVLAEPVLEILRRLRGE